MTLNPEQITGVGETDRQLQARTELLDFLAREGLRSIILTISQLRTVGAAHPLEYPHLPERAFSLEQVSAHIEAGLADAGYTDEDIHRLTKSTVTSPVHDPDKPRSNR